MTIGDSGQRREALLLHGPKILRVFGKNAKRLCATDQTRFAFFGKDVKRLCFVDQTRFVVLGKDAKRLLSSILQLIVI